MAAAAEMRVKSCFLDEEASLERTIAPAAQRGVRGHAVEIHDPAEERFPYSGRTEFRDPETGQKLVAGRAALASIGI